MVWDFDWLINFNFWGKLATHDRTKKKQRRSTHQKRSSLVSQYALSYDTVCMIEIPRSFILFPLFAGGRKHEKEKAKHTWKTAPSKRSYWMIGRLKKKKSVCVRVCVCLFVREPNAEQIIFSTFFTTPTPHCRRRYSSRSAHAHVAKKQTKKQKKTPAATTAKTTTQAMYVQIACWLDVIRHDTIRCEIVIYTRVSNTWYITSQPAALYTGYSYHICKT